MEANVTLADDAWNAPMGLAIGLVIPLSICGLPCAIITLGICNIPGYGPRSAPSVSDSNAGMALGFPIIFCCWCAVAALGAVALGFGVPSVSSRNIEDPRAEAPGLALTISGAVMLGMPLICFLVVLSCRIIRCSGSLCYACCYFCDVTRSKRRHAAERERRRYEEGFSQSNPFKEKPAGVGAVADSGDAEDPDVEEAAKLPESAHDAAAIPGWAAAATAEELEAGRQGELRNERQEEEDGVTTLTGAKPPDLGTRGKSGSALVDSVLKSVGLGALAGELGDIFAQGGSPLGSRRDGHGGGGSGSQAALRRERTRSLLQAGSAPVMQDPPSVELAEQQPTTEEGEVEVSIVRG